MKILAHCFGYPPTHNAGSENTMHAALRALQAQGHEVAVCANVRAETGVYDGVPVFAKLAQAELLERYRWAHVVITHLHVSRQAIFLAMLADRPLAHFIHNHNQVGYHNLTVDECDLMIFNSRWIQARQQWPGPSLVVNPPLIAEHYKARPGAAVTLVNLTENKGPRLVYELARRFPAVPFLAVRGGYGDQVHPPAALNNVTVMNNTADMRTVYRQTRILLMPSGQESWGRVAMEGAVSGIPTIASPTEGLRECLGDGGLFADPADTDAWATALRALLDPPAWKRASKAAKARWAQFQTESAEQLAALGPALLGTVERYAAASATRVPAVTFRVLPAHLEMFRNLWVRSYGVQFANGICVTRNARAIAMLRRGTYPVEEVNPSPGV